MGMSPARDRPDPAAIASAKDFATALTSLRIRSGLTVRELGRAAGIPGSTVGGYLSGRHLPPLTRPGQLKDLLTALDIAEEDQGEWISALQRVHSWRLPTDLRDRRPFLGLAAFTEADADLFFGRRDDIAGVHRLVTASAGSVVVVLGPSGSGKTSLVRAGLLPQLPPSWRTSVTSPGVNPGRAFLRAAEQLVETPTAVAGDPGGSTADPVEPGSATRRLLVVDQFEELWTLSASPASTTRAKALAVLAEFAADPRHTVLICLRSDFYAAAAAEPALLDPLRSRSYLLGPLTDPELASAITGPAGLFGISVTPGLVDQLVGDARHGATVHSAALPHLSHTLARMWQRSPHRALTVEDYQAVGRIAGSVAQSAQEAWDELSVDQREPARHLLLRLTVVDEGLPPVAGSLPLAQITDDVSHEILDHFVRHRLVVVDHDTARFAHEAVLTAWPALAGWVETDRNHLQLRRVVTREASAWQDSGRDPDLLLRGARLAAVREWTGDPRHPLGPVESEFISRSVAQADHRAARARRQIRRTRRLLAATTTLAVVAVLAAAALVSSRMTLAQQRDDALSRQIAAQSRYLAQTDPAAAAQLDIVAYRTADTLQARSMLLGATGEPMVTTLRGPVGPRMLAAAPGRNLLAAAGTMDTIELFDTSTVVPRLVAATPAPTTTIAGSSVYALAFSPDGKTLAAAGTAGRLRLIDVTDPSRPRVLGADIPLPDNASGEHTAYAVAFTPDGRQVLVGAATGGVLRWRLPTTPGDSLTSLPAIPVSGYVSAVAVAADGTIVAGTTSGSVSTWSITGAAPRELASTTVGRYVDWVAAQHHMVYVASRDLNAAFQLTRGPTSLGPPVKIAGFASWANWVEPMPDLNAVAIGSSDRHVTVVDASGAVIDDFSAPEAITSLADLGAGRLAIGLVDGQTLLRTTRPPAGDSPTDKVFFATWSANGRRLVDFPARSAARLWDTSAPLDPKLLSVLTGPADGIVLDGCGDISPDGHLVISGSYDGHLVGWDVTNPFHPRQVFTTKIAPSLIVQLRFIDESHLVASTSDKSMVVVALHGNGDPTVEQTIPDASDTFATASPDGLVLAGASLNGKVKLFRAGQSTPTATITSQGYVYGLAFSPDGRTLYTAGASKTVEVYDLSTLSAPRLVDTLHGPDATIYLLDVSPSGKIAAASLDGSVTIWQPSGPDYSLVETLQPGTVLFGVEWSPDDRHLAAVGQQDFLHIWTTNPAEAISTICRSAGDPITRDQWAAQLPDQPYQPPCPISATGAGAAG